MPRRRNRPTPTPTLLEDDAHHHDNCTTCGGYKVRGEELFWKSKSKNTSAAAVAPPATPKESSRGGGASKSSKASIIRQAGSLMEKIHEKGTAMVKNAKTRRKQNTQTKDEPPQAPRPHAEPTAGMKKVGHSKQNTQSTDTPDEANSPKRGHKNDSSKEPVTASAYSKTPAEMTHSETEAPQQGPPKVASQVSSESLKGLQDTKSEKEESEYDPHDDETNTANKRLQKKEEPLPVPEPEDTDKKDNTKIHSDNKPPLSAGPTGPGQQTMTNKENESVAASNGDMKSEDGLDEANDQSGDSGSPAPLDTGVEEYVDESDHSDDEGDAENTRATDIIPSKTPPKGSLVEPSYGSEAMQKLSAIVNAYATTDHSTRIIIDVQNDALPSNAKIQG